jgi:hypothetical protein
MKYSSRQRRLLEMAGILRRDTPDWMLLTEGDDDGGGSDDTGGDDDLFGDDSGDDGGDGGDDLFGDDDGGDEEGGDEEAEVEEEPAEELAPQDIKKYGTPIFQELDTALANAFEAAKKAGPVRAQEMETYPGQYEDEEDEVEASLANGADDGDEEDVEEALEDTSGSDGETDEEEVKQEFRNYRLNRREYSILVESKRLLREAIEEDALSSEEFDMAMFAQTINDLIQHRESKFDLPGAIYNGARQMVLNHMGKEGQIKFDEIFEAQSEPEVKEILGLTDEIDNDTSDANIPTAVGAVAGGGGAV